MKKIYYCYLAVLLSTLLYSQTTYSWRNDATTTNGNWNNSVHWWNGSMEALPGGGEILYLDGNVQTVMTNDLPSTNRFKINFGSTGAASRTVNGSTENTFYDYSGTWPKIQNNSGVNHTIIFPIKVGNTGSYHLEVEALTGGLTFGETINNNSRNILVYGDNFSVSGASRFVRFNRNLTGNGNLNISKSGVGRITAALSYSGETQIDNGEIWIELGGSTVSTSQVYVGNGGQQGNTAKLWLYNASVGLTYSSNITVNQGNSGSRVIGGLNTANTNTFSGNILNNSSNLNLTANTAGGITNFSGVISGSNPLSVTGNGKVQFSGNNTYTGPTTVTGTLEITASERIANSSNLVMNGGTFSTGTGFSETLGTIKLSANSNINLGSSSHQLNFAKSDIEGWTANRALTITGWTGIPGTSGTAGKIFVGTNASSLTAQQLSQITFAGITCSTGAMLLSNGELVPKPTPLVGGSISPGTSTVCSGTNSTALTLSGYQGTISKWQSAPVSDFSSGVTDIANTTANFTASNLTLTTYYRAQITNCSGTAYSSTATVTVNTVPAITSQSTSAQTVCKGATATAMTVTATGSNLTYQWYSNSTASTTGGTNLGSANGAQTSSFTPPTANVGRTYYYAVVSSAGCSSVTSAVSGQVMVTPSVINWGNIMSPNATICSGTFTTLKGELYEAGFSNNTSNSDMFIVQYAINSTDGNPSSWTTPDVVNWTTVSNPGSANNNLVYSANVGSALTPGTYFYSIRYSPAGCTNWYYGGARNTGAAQGQGGAWNGTSNINGKIIVNQSTLITSQPTPATQAVDVYAATTSITVSATGAGALSYQWYENSVNSNSGGTAISGATSSSYQPNSYVTGTFYYYCVVTSSVDNSCSIAVSATATVTINTSSTASWANIQLPKQTLSLYEGDGADVFAQVYIPDVTPAIGQGANVLAWIGYSEIDINPNSSSWTWIPAVYNVCYDPRVIPYPSHCKLNESFLPNNDEYWIPNFGANLPPSATGQYFVASRFQWNNGAFVYGGIDGTEDNASGGIWGVMGNNGVVNYSLPTAITTITWKANAENTEGEWNNATGPKIYHPSSIATDLTSPPSFETRELTLQNGVGLTIPSGSYVKIQDAIINNNTGGKTITVESDANLIQVNNVVNTGNVIVKRNNTTPSDQYSFWSSPVTGQYMRYMYSSNNTNTSYNAPYILYYNTDTDYFNNVASTLAVPGMGYAVKGPPSVADATFIGVLNNGDITYHNTTNGNSSGLRTGGTGNYNLVGNPYASNIDLDTLYTENTMNIESTFLFWDYTNNELFEQQGPNYSNYTSHNYAQYNSPSATGNKSPNGDRIPNHIAKVGQGFLVQAKNGNIGLLFNNDMRTSDSANSVFMGRSTIDPDRFWLRLASPDDVGNTMAVVYKAGASNGFDEYDSEIPAANSDNLYSMVGEIKSSINGRAVFNIEDKVPLGYSAFQSGTYKISIAEKEGIFLENQKVYLKDHITGDVFDLSEGSYQFNTDSGEYTGRFEIVYQPQSVLDAGAGAENKITVYQSGNHIVVRSKSGMISRIELYDISGKLLLQKTPRTREVFVDSTFYASGVYLVKIEHGNNTTVRKIRK